MNPHDVIKMVFDTSESKALDLSLRIDVVEKRRRVTHLIVILVGLFAVASFLYTLRLNRLKETPIQPVVITKESIIEYVVNPVPIIVVTKAHRRRKPKLIREAPGELKASTSVMHMDKDFK